MLTPIYDPKGLRYSWWDLFRDAYFTFDRRTLGFTRILLGLFLIGDLFRRTWDWVDMFSVEGVLPNHVNLFRRGADNFTIFNAFSTSGELWVLWAVILATYVCLLVGYKTKLAQVLSLLWVASMNGRVLLIENGGYVVHNLLLLWTAFLPLGDRFSVDAMRASLARSKERSAEDLNDRSHVDDPYKPNAYVTILGLVLILQLASIYFFNVVHKTGTAWKNGTAVHYVLYVDRMVNPAIALVREYIPGWAILAMTRVTLAFEASIPVCLLAPIGRVWARRLVIGMMNALHLAFGTTFVLGPFAWALCVFSTLLFGKEDWEVAAQTMRRVHRARVVGFDPTSPGALWACRVLMRMDRFSLLTFEERPGLGGKLTARATKEATEAGATKEGATKEGAAALADIVAALPLGPVMAWKLRLPGIRGLVDAALRAMDRNDFGAVLGLSVPAAAGVAEPPTPLARGKKRFVSVLRELAIVAMWAGAINQAAVELWCINRRIRVPQPEPLKVLSHKLRFLQGWFMFSPNPVMDDGTIVVDAVTIDGRHLNPFTGKEPDFDLIHAKSYEYNQIWSDYFNRMHLGSNSGYRDAMKEYLFRYPERTGRPQDVIVSGDVFWVKDWNPKWGRTDSYGQEQEKVFTFVNPQAQAQADALAKKAGVPAPVAAPPPSVFKEAPPPPHRLAVPREGGEPGTPPQPPQPREPRERGEAPEGAAPVDDPEPPQTPSR